MFIQNIVKDDIIEPEKLINHDEYREICFVEYICRNLSLISNQ